MTIPDTPSYPTLSAVAALWRRGLVDLDSAADSLGVSVAWLIDRVEAGELTGTIARGRPWIALGELLAFKERLRAESEAALIELARLTQELGDDDDEATR